MNPFNQKISDLGVVPVIKLNHPKRDAANLARALCAGGLPVAEVTFRAAGAPEAIRIMSETCPEMLVGAGTVTSPDQVNEAQAAGAKFVVSPGFSAKVVARAQELGMPIYPGCTTATEYQMALEAGLEVVKFFPAQQCGGVAAIQALAAPFSMLKVMPTGGVGLKNLGEYLACPAVCACGGSYMVKAELIESGSWDTITDLCRQSVEIVKAARAK